MQQGFWQKRMSRRRLLGGATSLAIVGSGAGLLLPRRAPARSAAQNDFVIAEDIRHTPVELAGGQLQGLRWDTPAGQPALRAASSSGGVYTSPIVKTSFPSTHIGLHWLADAPNSDQISFELRTSTDGWTWSPWQRVYIEAEPHQNPRGERFGALIWAAGARYVQYRAAFPADTPDATALRNVTVTVLAAAPPATLQAARTRRTPTPKPTAGKTPAPTHDAGSLDPPFGSDVLISRETWGAPESYRYDSRGYESWPRMYLPTKKLIVHHTAGLSNTNPQDPTFPYPNYSADQAVQEVRGVYYYHAITLGWGDIGYNALVDRFGRVFEGRRGRDNGPNGGREIISPDVVAGHALNCNEGTAGVALIANFEENQIGDNEQTMLSTLVEFLAWSCRRHYVWPNASSDFLQVNWVWRQGVQNIAGHREVNQTACPGQYLYAYLSNIRQSVAERAAALAIIKPAAQITSLPSQANIDAHSATFSWKSPDNASAEFSYYLEGWIPNLNTDEEYYITGVTSDKRPAWSSFSSATSATLKVPEPGRYTFHVRARDSKSDGAYESNWTFVAQSGARTSYTIGVPGVIKN
ncbi:MAG: peptidoglycan recognition protein family protein [Dehalococcoidia bacterium]|nr:peptidoglycan recognition protein family protein [Dehalococcoidia bacterium]